MTILFGILIVVAMINVAILFWVGLIVWGTYQDEADYKPGGKYNPT